MPGITTFQNPKFFLKEILQKIDGCKIQLPDFQRGWIWDDSRICSLLASVSLSFPIGAVMMLQTGNPGVRFKIRPFEGVTENEWVEVEPELLVLDGQQRLTALYQALIKTGPSNTKNSNNKPINRYYYLDIERCLDPEADRDECVRSIPEDKIVRNFRGEVMEDYSTPEKEYAAGLFPVNQIFESLNWMNGYQKYWHQDGEKNEIFFRFHNEVIQHFEQYQLPVIEMNNETPKEAVCLVFEKVNTGGVSLTVFELLTATFAADNFSLRDDWEKVRSQFASKKVLENIKSDDFLQVITLLATMQRRRKFEGARSGPERAPAISCKRKDILKLELSDYQAHRDEAVAGFLQAAKFLRMQWIYSARDLPYQTQIIPLAATFAILKDKAENDTVRQKLSRWYWCGVFGELYGSSVESRFAKDVPELVRWVLEGADEPTTVHDASFARSRLEELKTRRSAAYKGIFALMMREGCMDFRSGQPIDVTTYYDESVDIHHIFPKRWCKDHPDHEHPGGYQNAVDSIINKTPISACTNRKIGRKTPSVYLEEIERKEQIEPGRLDEILRSHVIDPAALRTDDFRSFYEHRCEEIIRRIEAAMGKSVIREEEEQR
ncbi:MAG: DUF262 domain-containing protein [Methanofollis sp.]|nr:DUF262 domain-containing protein [Methanofollis sp.]